MRLYDSVGFLFFICINLHYMEDRLMLSEFTVFKFFDISGYAKVGSF